MNLVEIGGISKVCGNGGEICIIDSEGTDAPMNNYRSCMKGTEYVQRFCESKGGYKLLSRWRI